MPSAAFKTSGTTVEPEWIDQHGDAVINTMTLACRRHATCLGTAGNTYWFCSEVLASEVRPVCDTLFPRRANQHDWEQCNAFRDVYLLGIDIRAEALSKTKRECAGAAAKSHGKPLDVWMVPPRLSAGYSGPVTFYALDPDTHVPVLARITFENQGVYAPSNPAGNPVTFFPIPYTVKYARVPNAEGHTDLAPPMILVTAPAYPEASSGPPWPEMRFRLAADVPKLVVEMEPPGEKLRRGTNRVTITTRDAATGKPVEMRVILGADAIGNSNTPLTIEVGRSGHRPEIWLTSLFDQYSDVVVARAR